MPVEIVDSGGTATATLVTAAQAAGDALLDCLGLGASELCVVLVSDSHMRELNAKWRGKDAPTDVLSFSQLDEGADARPAAATPQPGTMLGDIVVSVDTMKRQAEAGGWSDDEELARLILHGLLHLLGYDHEHDEDARAMHAEEERLVALLRERGIACAWEDGAA